MALKNLTGKILYGALFCLLFPALLLWWNSALPFDSTLDKVFEVPGWMMAFAGLFIIAESMFRLWRSGKGLPMNAFPPKHFVTTGSYSYFHHPIYTGFCMSLAGLSLATSSVAGLFLVTPVVILLCVALVWGYEKHDIDKRFGSARHNPLFGLPPENNEKPYWFVRVAVLLSAFVPWLLLYEIVIWSGVNSDFFDTMLPSEKNWPVIESMQIPYALTYVFVCAVPFILSSNHQLRSFLKDARWTIALGIFIQIIIPFYAGPREFEPQTIFGTLILLEREYDGVSGAFPSFHVLWTFIAAFAWTNRFPTLKSLFYGFAILVAVSCVGIGVHAIADVISAVAIYFIVRFRQQLWTIAQRCCEKLANSWKAWQPGKLRIINHSVYAGLAAFVGILIVSQFQVSIPVILIVTFSSIIGGAAWGQFVEGSSALMRPFGYFGALLGGMCGVIASAIIFDTSFMSLLAPFALASPWVQAIGRLRCLVQGCCHGRPAQNSGIHYFNEHSRVCISGLKGIRIHNTQLYSIVMNVIIGLILARMWYGRMPAELITGLYFILAGCARFIEEAYRGEIQTARIGGLSFYQWLAIVSVIAGILATTFPASRELTATWSFQWHTLLTSFITGISWAFAMGMDFPYSKLRFSRLTG